jgi:uncharacterized protein (TIGR02996 family)
MEAGSSFLRPICREPEEERFLVALLDNPDDHLLQLVYADWLEERGDPRAEYLRVRQAVLNGQSTAELLTRQGELLAALNQGWLAIIGVKYVTGRVTRITDEATYVDLGGLEGELHLREFAW